MRDHRGGQEMRGLGTNGHGEREYPLGWNVQFLDDTATVAIQDVGQRIVLAWGTINGEPFKLPDGSRAVPVWAHREGREPTTILVHEENIVDVTQGRFP